MSATVFYFPGSYVELLPDLRTRLSKGQASSGNIKLGVSTNFDKLCGCVLQVLDAGLLPTPCCLADPLSHRCLIPEDKPLHARGPVPDFWSDICQNPQTGVFLTTVWCCRTW